MSSSPPRSDDAKSPIKATNVCPVCGDIASTINYGALSCLSCRTFFRRNGFSTTDVSVCRFDGNCEVNMFTRKNCAGCRLAKCLAIGMSPEFIRKESTGTKRKSSMAHDQQLTVYQPVTTISQPSALDQPADGSDVYLSSSEWTVISNVVHAFESFSPVADIRRTIETITTSASSLQFDLSHSLQMLSSLYNSLESFISSTPDFKVLTPSERCSLFQRNMLGLLSIGGMYLMRECGIFDKPENEMAVLPLYGNEVVQQVKNISTQMDRDSTLIKLMLIALAFSSNCFPIHTHGDIDKDSLLLGTFRLYGTQNVYVELTWKYLVHRYGFDESAQRISILVKRLLDTLRLSTEIYENNQVFQAFINKTMEQVEQSPIISDKNIIPLWGKN